MTRSRAAAFADAALITVLLAACASSASTAGPTAAGSGSASLGPRPSSAAVVSIVKPVSGTAVTGSTVHVVLSLTGATIVTQTSTDIRPDQGHVHLYVDNVLVSMNYGLSIHPLTNVKPGNHTLEVEFVASDHRPWNPRIIQEVVFVVKK